MLELEETKAGVVRCLAAADVLERFPAIPGAIRCRVAPDELLLLTPARPSEEIVSEAVAALGDSGVVVDQSGGWTVWTLSGSDMKEALARLSAVPPGAGFLQGRIADVPAKAVVLDTRIHVLVAASHGAYVEGRMRAACHDLLPSWWEQSLEPELAAALEPEPELEPGPQLAGPPEPELEREPRRVSGVAPEFEPTPALEPEPPPSPDDGA